MGIFKLIFLLLLAWLGFSLWRRFAPSIHRVDSAKGDEQMVRCAHCDLHLPQQEAINHQGNNYCSAAHRDTH